MESRCCGRHPEGEREREKGWSKSNHSSGHQSGGNPRENMGMAMRTDSQNGEERKPSWIMETKTLRRQSKEQTTHEQTEVPKNDSRMARGEKSAPCTGRILGQSNPLWGTETHSLPTPNWNKHFCNRTFSLWSTNYIINYLKPISLKLKAGAHN